MSNILRLNNFKAFGPEMQSFSEKPITLIYGPNSIGKSSLLHSQLNLIHFDNNLDHDLYKSFFAGDELDFGGFEKYIHKHDISKTLTYERILTEKKDILKVFNIEKLYDIDILNKYININFINHKLESNYQDTDIKFKYIFNTVILEHKFLLEFYLKFLDQNEIDTKKRKLNLIKEKLFNEALSEHYNIPIENIFQNEKKAFKYIFDVTIAQFKKSKEEFEILLGETLQTKPSDILDRIQFFKELKQIDSIKAQIKININNNNIIHKKIIYIDNEILFASTKKDKLFKTINYQNHYLKKYKEIKNKIDKFKCRGDKWDLFNDYHFSFILLAIVSTKISKTQYYGPLRHFPKRFELYQVDKKIDKNLDSKQLTFGVKAIYKLVKLLIDAIDAIDGIKIMPQFLKKILVIPVQVVFFVIMFLSVLINKNFKKSFLYNDKNIDNWNKIVPEKYQILGKNKFKSSDTWKRLIKSSDLVNKLNLWLGDKKKLRNNYAIKIKKKPITYLRVLGGFVSGLFGGKNEDDLIFYSTLNEQKNWNKNHKILYKISMVWNYFEKILKIEQRYESQVVFIDTSKNTEVTPRDMGLGISQMLPILISALDSKKTSLYLEQPELHLHPAIQMELADTFIRSANENKNTFMIESHSEHLLLRIMKRMRQTAENKKNRDKSLDLIPDDICLLYVDSHKGKTFVRELTLDSDGTLLSKWPNGFFEDSYNEMFS